ncbi:hypothetical protein QBC38DRAFT_460252 [Podospora fimiseda]|uniref:Nephrocystin 3-like N-terminal domain-containing protein n=1 Tax=Podospora fimiseda TaxID=252190 RepID=A0AAN6YQE8_9PEZI|nr:hypothetical protein QBC38DRAFT_460252 [Podospora fimiseda]
MTLPKLTSHRGASPFREPEPELAPEGGTPLTWTKHLKPNAYFRRIKDQACSTIETLHHDSQKTDAILKVDKDEEEFLSPVAAGIRSLITKMPKPIDKISDLDKAALYALCRDDFHAYFLDKKPTKGTCRWVHKQPKFQAWKSKTSKKPNLSLQGPPASGKSFLANHIISQFPLDEVIHCFLNATDPDRSDLDALLKATLQ